MIRGRKMSKVTVTGLVSSHSSILCNSAFCMISTFQMFDSVVRI